MVSQLLINPRKCIPPMNPTSLYMSKKINWGTTAFTALGREGEREAGREGGRESEKD